MMKFKVLFLFLLLTHLLSAQMKSVIGQTQYPFWIHLPAAEVVNNKPPLLVFLHGRSLSGTNLNRVKRYGVLNAIEKGLQIPAIVIAPQVASGSWNPDKVLELINYIKKNYDINENKVYVCGMSLGGYGTLHFAGKYPDKITAGVAICGGGNVPDGCRLSKVPLWIEHGTNDRAVPLSESQKVVNAIKKCNPEAELKFIVVPGGTHGSVERIFHRSEMYDWLLSHEKK
ncbi:carboxylesterase family protein [Flavobacterium branchiophilum]|nr:alpha/beta hydrolase-fold protein [Flavobacterium branchiophilum]